MLRLPEVRPALLQEHKSQNEQQDDAEDPEARLACDSVEQLIQRRTDHAGKLAENIHESEVFPAALRRNQLAEIAAAQRLDAALHRAHQRCQHPEKDGADADRAFQRQAQRPVKIHQEAHQKTDDRDKGIHQHCKRDQLQGAQLSGQIAEQDGAGHGHQLGHQQRQDHADGAKTQRIAVLGGHGNDGIHAVDVEEISQQKKQNQLKFQKLRPTWNKIKRRRK